MEEVIKLSAGSDNLLAFTMSCQGLLARFTNVSVRQSFLNGDFAVPHNTMDMLASLDSLRGEMLPSPHLFDSETEGAVFEKSLIFINNLLNRDSDPVEVDGKPLRHPMSNLECREYLNALMQSPFWDEKISDAYSAALYGPPSVGNMPLIESQHDMYSATVPGSGNANQDSHVALPGSVLSNQAMAVGTEQLPGSEVVNRTLPSDLQNLPGSTIATQVKPGHRPRSSSFGSIAPCGVNDRARAIQSAPVPTVGLAEPSVGEPFNTNPSGPQMVTPSSASTSCPQMVALSNTSTSGPQLVTPSHPGADSSQMANLPNTSLVGMAAAANASHMVTMTRASTVAGAMGLGNPTVGTSCRALPPPTGAGIGGGSAAGHGAIAPTPAVPLMMLPTHGAAQYTVPGSGQYGTGCGAYGIQSGPHLPTYPGWYPGGAAWTAQPTAMSQLSAVGLPPQQMQGAPTFQPPPIATSGAWAGANQGASIPLYTTGAAVPHNVGLGAATGSANSQALDPLTQLLGQLRLNKEAVPPAKFDGTQSLPLSSFLRSYEKYYDSRYQDSDSGRSRKLGEFLTGGAKIMYDTLKGDTAKYSVLKPRLLALYTSMKSSETTKEKALTEFNSTSLRPGEPLLLYCTRLEQLGDQIFGSQMDRDCQLVARFRATAPPAVVEGIRDLERVLSVVGDGKVSWDSVKKLAAADSRTLWRNVEKPAIGMPASYGSGGPTLAGQSDWLQPTLASSAPPGGRPSVRAAIEGIPATTQAIQMGISDPLMASIEANNPVPPRDRGTVNQITPDIGSGASGRSQPPAATGRGAGNTHRGTNPRAKSRPSWANSNYCSWCGARSHNFAGCWARKGLCRYCGSGDHQPSACPKFQERFGQTVECPTCQGNHLGKDCNQISHNLN